MDPSALSRIGVGAASGTVATIPMSIVMFGAQKLGMLPVMPPEEVTGDVMALAGADLDEGSRNVLSTISHVGYGAAAGAVYEMLVPARARGVGSGIVFGAALYSGSYLGWLPALGLNPSGQGRPNAKSASMLLAHVVFGVVLGGIAGRAPLLQR